MRLGLRVGGISWRSGRRSERELHRAPVLVNQERADALAHENRRVSPGFGQMLNTLTADHPEYSRVVDPISKRHNAGESNIGGAGPSVQQVADETTGNADNQGWGSSGEVADYPGDR